MAARATKRQSTPKRYFIIDFDSTFVRGETVDMLARVALEGRRDKNAVLEQVQRITADGMEGKITFAESLKKRLALFAASKGHVKEVTEQLKKDVTPSIARNKEFLKRMKGSVYVVSSGFKECILPVVKDYGIDAKHVLASEMNFSKKGILIGAKGALAENGGKARAVKALKLKGEVVMVGDGMTDYEVRESGTASRFYAFTENIAREPVVARADGVARNFDELLYQLDLPRAQSYPKSKLTALLLEGIHPLAAERLRSEGYRVETSAKALSEEELVEKLKDVNLIGIRSGTHITKTVLEHAPHLIAIGAFCIGTNQIDLPEASRRGVAVFNSPYANGRSVVEMVIGFIIMLYRRFGDQNISMHQGIWNKSAKGAHEIRGKTLGIVGYGNIGTQLSVAAEALGMRVVFYDLIEKPAIGNARRAGTLAELLAESDVVTLHVDGRPTNKKFIDAEALGGMKEGAFLINASRGPVVDTDALADALANGRLGGAALDVFPEEPKGSPGTFSSPLQTLPNVILTPHIGGSTAEAQHAIAEHVSGKLSAFIDTGDTMLSVNLPNLQLPALQNAHRFIYMHKNAPGVLARMNTLLGKHRINIVGQYLGTNEHIGYVITDVGSDHGSAVIEELKKLPETIRLRVLY
ncbi:MAG: phosphoglycerate dehydrogenase [Patescibacteria group bacterium]|nr:phosphoglycerate dehydrogenase [Patescibacteria group bacterium]